MRRMASSASSVEMTSGGRMRIDRSPEESPRTSDATRFSSVRLRVSPSGRSKATKRPRPRTLLTRPGWRSSSRRSPATKLLADARGVGEQAVLFDDLDDALAAHHVDEVAAPGRVDAARDLEDRVDLVDPRPGGDAAHLGLLGEGEDVRLDAEVLEGPPAAGGAEAGLHLVEDEQELVLVGELAQPAEELGAEVVVAALALDRLDDERRRCRAGCRTPPARSRRPPALRAARPRRSPRR